MIQLNGFSATRKGAALQGRVPESAKMAKSSPRKVEWRAGRDARLVSGKFEKFKLKKEKI
jgi:hypothetical protein